ncbi:MAG: hypothetical protein DMG36_10295 [Acidobacteria bacterium]|nr:MAG: hypothetical protein DMG36_10295 [Acidobacteriota bacterium]
MKCVGLASQIRDKKMYEPFDILERHGFIRLDDLDKIADLPERKAEKLYIDHIFISIWVSNHEGVPLAIAPPARHLLISGSTLTPLESALTSHPRLIEKTATLNPLECAVTRFRTLTL